MRETKSVRECRASSESRKGYVYYSSQRPVFIGTYPKARIVPKEIVNFDGRVQCDDGHCLAYGYLVYDMPLTEEEQKGYELKPSWRNPDVIDVVQSAANAMGKLEDEHQIPERNRFTYKEQDGNGYLVHLHVPLHRFLQRSQALEGMA